jgi:hypothetical protein
MWAGDDHGDTNAPSELVKQETGGTIDERQVSVGLVV